ncbi:vitamin K-dependent protein C-like [Argiope bruennichi]|uniref:vitamin K-dependent protein C-like n=1 Tax=Argiope bruennichi TaxID=94029 RepID=UPI0024957916|nr:vitamin K-dependent protein C-like [Argiope bruennichi]
MDLLDCVRLNLFLIVFNICHAEVEKQCPKSLSLKNGKVRFQSRGGVTAVFSCDAGFTLRGSNVSHCQTDGHWSVSEPTCVSNDQRCPAAEIESILLQPGRAVNISCAKDTTITDAQHFWTTNGTFITNTFSDNNTLVISPKTPGMYVCLTFSSDEVVILRAVKMILDQTDSSELTLEKCNLTFKDTETNISTMFGSNVTLSCEISSLSTKIHWLKNGETISDKHGAYSKYNLNITNIHKADEGNYTCIVQEKNIPQCSVAKSMIVKAEKVTRLPSGFACGQPVNTARRWRRVIDGNRAAPLSAPWMCMLSMDREPPFCGCSLISEKWVVTAAHCFRDANKLNSSFMSLEEIYKKVKVKFGKQQRRQFEKGEVVRMIQSLLIHPKFVLDSTARNLANEHDIALAKLNESLIFQPSILPICLPPAGFMDSIPAGTLGVVTGWGRVSVRDSIMALTLQEAFLPLVNNSSCQETTNYAITDNMLCAGYAESYRPDTCSGDSGGPFVLQKLNSWYLIGVVSWGEGCSTPKKFGVYTRVENYVPWIQSVISGKLTP